MAGDWTKVRTSLPRDGRVLEASRKCHALSVTNNGQTSPICHAALAMFGAIVKFWCHSDAHANSEGVLVGYTKLDVDQEVGLPGFCDSLPSDWIEFTPEGWVKLPHYDRHNGDNAKKRAQALNRKRSQRERDNGHAESVTDEGQKSRAKSDSSVTRVQSTESTESTGTPPTPSGVEQLLNRAKALLRIRPSTPLDSGQASAWKKNKGVVAATPEEEWLLLIWWFKQPSGDDDIARYRRTTFGPLLNHWNDEVTKARVAAKKMGANFSSEKKEGRKIPDDWKDLILDKSPEMNLAQYSTFQELPESMRAWVFELDRERNKRGEA